MEQRERERKIYGHGPLSILVNSESALFFSSHPTTRLKLVSISSYKEPFSTRESVSLLKHIVEKVVHQATAMYACNNLTGLNRGNDMESRPFNDENKSNGITMWLECGKIMLRRKLNTSVERGLCTFSSGIKYLGAVGNFC